VCANVGAAIAMKRKRRMIFSVASRTLFPNPRLSQREESKVKQSPIAQIRATHELLFIYMHIHFILRTKTNTGTSAQIELGSVGRCLDIEEAKTSDGANVQLFSCLSKLNDHQSWDYSPSGTLMSRLHGKCLDAVQSNSDGSNVQVWSCSGAKNQRWAFTPDGQIMSMFNRKCLQAAGTGDRANVRLWTCDSKDPLQLFKIRGGVAPSEAPTTKTVGGCTCKDSWSLNGIAYVYPNNCAPGNSLESKPWCFTKQDGPPCIGSNGQVDWDFCDSLSPPPPPPPSSTSSSSSPKTSPASNKGSQSTDGATIVRHVEGGASSQTKESDAIRREAEVERESFRGSGISRSSRRSEEQRRENSRVNTDGSITRHIDIPSGNAESAPVHVDDIVTCVFGRKGPNGCICDEGYKLPFCDDCSKRYFGFPKCQRKKFCHTDENHHHFHCQHKGTCDHSTGKCICHVNYAGSHCQECAPGFSGPDCARSHSGDGSGFFMILSFAFAGGIFFYGRSRGFF